MGDGVLHIVGDHQSGEVVPPLRHHQGGTGGLPGDSEAAGPGTGGQAHLQGGTSLRGTAAGPDPFITENRAVRFQAERYPTGAFPWGILFIFRTVVVYRGYLPLKGGHRLGLCGSVWTEEGQVRNLRSLSSLNLRVAHAVPGCGAPVLRALGANGELPNR